MRWWSRLVLDIPLILLWWSTSCKADPEDVKRLVELEQAWQPSFPCATYEPDVPAGGCRDDPRF